MMKRLTSHFCKSLLPLHRLERCLIGSTRGWEQEGRQTIACCSMHLHYQMTLERLPLTLQTTFGLWLCLKTQELSGMMTSRSLQQSFTSFSSLAICWEPSHKLISHFYQGSSYTQAFSKPSSLKLEFLHLKVHLYGCFYKLYIHILCKLHIQGMKSLSGRIEILRSYSGFWMAGTFLSSCLWQEVEKSYPLLQISRL